MSTTHSFLGHLALRFAPHPENLATESLAYILEKSPGAKRALMAFLNKLGGPLPETLRFQPQANGPDGSIPDLVGTDSDGEQMVIIEAKFWAGLTDNQPVAYLNRLSPSSEAILLFVAPALRSCLLWNELLSRCKTEGVTFSIEKDISIFPEVKLTKIQRHHTLALSNWGTLLTYLLQTLNMEGDTVAVSNLLELQGLCDRMDDTFLPLSSEELTSSIGSRFIQFSKLVDSVATDLVAEGLGSYAGKSSCRGGSYLQPMTIYGCGCILMVNSEYWAHFRSTPIWLNVRDPNWKPAGVDLRNILLPLQLEDPPRVLYDQNQKLVVPIMLPAEVDRRSVVESLLGQVREVANLLRKLDKQLISKMIQYDQDDLRDRVHYERTALDFVRNNLDPRTEGVDRTYEFKSKDYKSDPNSVTRDAKFEPAIVKINQLDVNEALNELLPLIFTCSFKVNDMIAEWILEKLPCIQKDTRITFTEKKAKFKKHKLPSPLPPLFQENPYLEKCFSRLYIEMIPSRHEITHNSGFELHKNGLSFDRTNPKVLSKPELNSYVSFTCLLLKFLLDEVPPKERTQRLNMLNRDLLVLQKYHGETIPKERRGQLIAVSVIAHEKERPLPSPLNIPIPIDFIRETFLDKGCGSGGRPDVLHILIVIAEDGTTRLEWEIPEEYIPRDKFTIFGGSDPKWLKFRSMK